jgi:hypothetical protein
VTCVRRDDVSDHTVEPRQQHRKQTTSDVFLGRPLDLTWPFSVGRGRHVHCDTRGYCGRQDARADSLRSGLQPFTCGEVVEVTRCARAAEAAHIVFRVLSQNSISVLNLIDAASTAHLLLCRCCCDSYCPSQRSTPRVTSGRGVSEQPKTSGTGKRADLARAGSRYIER